VKLDDSAQDKVFSTKDGMAQTVVTVDAVKFLEAFKKLKEQINEANQNLLKTILIQVEGNSGEEWNTTIKLPAEVLLNASRLVPDAVISIISGGMVYKLPIQVMDVELLAEALDVQAKELQIRLIMEKLPAAQQKWISSIIAKHGGGTPLTDAVQFRLKAEANGKSIDIHDFNGKYVERIILLPSSVFFQQASAFRVDPETGELFFVPSIIGTNAEGATEAVIKRDGNSIYTVAAFSKSFKDVNSHWARDEIEKLASKLIVTGIDEGRFAPDAKVTRAQFTAMLVRAMGLSQESETAAGFGDIKQGVWYEAAVSAAVRAGLVKGESASVFNPDSLITREQMVLMVNRAMAYVGHPANISANGEDLLSHFNDGAEVSLWARDAFAAAMDKKLLQVMENQTLKPKQQSTRAEAVVTLVHFLQQVEFINAE